MTETPRALRRETPNNDPAPDRPQPARGRDRPRMRRVAFWAVYYTATVALCFLLLEALILGSLRFPALTAHLPDSLRFFPVWTYTYLDRSKIHEFYRYDPDLAYTLQPGLDAVWTNREFAVPLRANSLGLRDDETSAARPQAVALGDSFGMGWGVPAAESYAAIVENGLGVSLLNAGLPSYGAARETTLLAKRIDPGALRYLIVQYCENDLVENLRYLDADRSYNAGTLDAFRTNSERDRQRRRYYPGKYLVENLKMLRAKLDPKPSPRDLLSPTASARSTTSSSTSNTSKPSCPYSPKSNRTPATRNSSCSICSTETTSGSCATAHASIRPCSCASSNEQSPRKTTPDSSRKRCSSTRPPF